MPNKEFTNISGIYVCDQTARDSIPTKISQLENDSGFITNNIVNDTIINTNTTYSSNKIENIKENLSSQIKEIVLQDKLKNRRISYNFSATPWQFAYDCGEHPARPEQITSQLEKMKYLGFDGIVVMATLIDDGNGGIDFNIPLDRYL